MPRLVITRKSMQSIVLDIPAGPARRVKVTTLDADHSQMRIAIEADAEVRILRTELLHDRRPEPATALSHG